MRNRILSLGLTQIVLLGACMTGAAQTDAALSLYGSFSQKVTNGGVAQSPSNSAGGIFELRHIANPVLGFEGTYSFNRANESYSSLLAITCPVNPVNPCPPLPASVAANRHEVTADWVPSVKVANLRPFGVLGIGLLLDEPAGSQSNTTSKTQAVYVYGAGVDWGLLPHIGLRLQYRGNLYRSPNLSTLYGSVDKFTQTAEPMIGVYFRL